VKEEIERLAREYGKIEEPWVYVGEVKLACQS
jgi:hypothetical protein